MDIKIFVLKEKLKFGFEVVLCTFAHGIKKLLCSLKCNVFFTHC